jgi:predicted protein tyrosine phosphatase
MTSPRAGASRSKSNRSLQPDLTIHHVCGIDELGVAPLAAASRIVSILDVYGPAPEELRAVSVPVLTLRFDDVTYPSDPAAPRAEHVRSLLAFDADAADDERLVVHCTAGISRSTAALAVLLARRHPDRCDEIFDAIRRIRPMAWPNPLLVAHGDRILGLGGRLSAAAQRLYEAQLRDHELGFS